METGYIYKIINKIDGMSYIGQTTNIYKRWMKHLSVARTNKYKYKSYLYDAMRKNGFENFEIIILEECPLELLEEREKYWIEELNTFAPNGYNLTMGGKSLYNDKNPFFGKSHSQKIKELISKANTGSKRTEEQLQKIRINNCKEKNPFFGKKHSPETITRITTANRKNGCYDNTRKRMLANNPSKPKFDVFATNELTKEVLYFTSLREAAKYLILNNLIPEGRTKKVECVMVRIREASIRNIPSYGYTWKCVNKGVSTIENTLDDSSESE